MGIANDQDFQSHYVHIQQTDSRIQIFQILAKVMIRKIGYWASMGYNHACSSHIERPWLD
ncbi:hypothetical protein N7453_007115 [Penicillium expansum]|nr:hypothetical protein N7453_007115 [Penicillium expansum]